MCSAHISVFVGVIHLVTKTVKFEHFIKNYQIKGGRGGRRREGKGKMRGAIILTRGHARGRGVSSGRRISRRTSRIARPLLLLLVNTRCGLPTVGKKDGIGNISEGKSKFPFLYIRV